MPRAPRILLALPCILALAATARAGGINLSWNDCGTFGQSIESFACDTNTGVHTMVASFVSPVVLEQMAGLGAQIELQSADPTLPAWWELALATGCRKGLLFTSADFLDGPSSCLDPWGGQAATAAYVYVTGYQVPNRVRIGVVIAVPAAAVFPIDNSSQYYAFKVVIRNPKTVGTGSCGGCQTPACMVLDYIELDNLPGDDYRFSNVLDRLDISWQCPGSIATEGALCQVSCPVPAHRPSWGGIKSLYR